MLSKAMIHGLFAVAIAAAGATAMAQDGTDRGWWPGWGMSRMMMDGPMMGLDGRGMLDRIDGRLAFIKAELDIRDDQTAQWDKLATAIRQNAEVHNDMMRAMMEGFRDGSGSKGSLPERLVFMETHMEARLEQLRAVRQALEELYAVLDDAQKETADQVVLPAMGMGQGMMMMR